MPEQHHWSAEAENVLRSMRAEGKSFKEIQRQLNSLGFQESDTSIRRHANRLAVEGPKPKLYAWTEPMIAVLRDLRHAPHHKVAEVVSARFGVHVTAQACAAARGRHVAGEPEERIEKRIPLPLALTHPRQPVRYLEPFISIMLRVPDPNIGRKRA